MSIFLHSLQSEWLKRRRSTASILVWSGSFLIPALFLISRFDDMSNIAANNANAHIWENLFNRHWQFMALFLLPMGLILATSLVTQLEFRNNTWKQVHTTPQSLHTIFWTKLTVIIIMLLMFFILFNIGIYLTAVIPVIVPGVHYPAEPLPFKKFAEANSLFLLDCLPIIALQFGLGLQCRNFLIPFGIGIGLYVGSMIGLLWRYGYIIPYIYCALNIGGKKAGGPHVINHHYWAVGWTIGLIGLAYILYLTKKDKS